VTAERSRDRGRDVLARDAAPLAGGAAGAVVPGVQASARRGWRDSGRSERRSTVRFAERRRGADDAYLTSGASSIVARVSVADRLVGTLLRHQIGNIQPIPFGHRGDLSGVRGVLGRRGRNTLGQIGLPGERIPRLRLNCKGARPWSAVRRKRLRLVTELVVVRLLRAGAGSVGGIRATSFGADPSQQRRRRVIRVAIGAHGPGTTVDVSSRSSGRGSP